MCNHNLTRVNTHPVWTVQVAIPGNPAIMFSSLDQLLAASTVQCSDTGLLNALRMVVSLRDSVLEASPRLAGLTPTCLCGVLLLYNSSLMRLCLALQCPEMLQLAVQLPPEACPQLRFASSHLCASHYVSQLLVSGRETVVYGWCPSACFLQANNSMA